MKRGFWSAGWLNSRIQGEDVQKSERILGHFLGPCLAAAMYSSVSGYLIQFYTDVLGLTGSILTMMPIASRVFSSLFGMILGHMIDRTQTRQGKARPWLLLSGVLLPVSGILLYAVPRMGSGGQIAWVVVSYNLFSSVAMTVYSMSHSMMLPLSTRNSTQRDGLSVLASTGVSMIPGTLVTVVMPLLVKTIGVGGQAHASWLTVMGCISALALPAVLLEYYFTVERVGRDGQTEPGSRENTAFKEQLSACFRDKYWLMYLTFTTIYTLFSGLSNTGALYYCNWVLADSVAEGAERQVLVNVVGQAPLGLGVIALWPMVRRYGKRRITMLGFFLAAAGSAVILTGNGSLVLALAGLMVRAVGLLPTYVLPAHQADALDHLERKNGFRADGLSASVFGVVQGTAASLGQTILLWGLSLSGYIPPESVGQAIAQPEPVRTFLKICFAGLPAAGFIFCAVIMMFYRAEAEGQSNMRGVDGDKTRVV